MGLAGSIFIVTMATRIVCPARILVSIVSKYLPKYLAYHRLTLLAELDLPEYDGYEQLRQQVYTAMTAGSEYFGFA